MPPMSHPLEVMIDFSQLTFPFFMAVVSVAPHVIQQFTVHVRTGLAILFLTALCDLWAIIGLALWTLGQTQGVINRLLMLLIVGSGVLVTYGLLIPFGGYVTDVSVYRDAQLSRPGR